MSKQLELKIGSTVYGKIQAARMSERERQQAISAMQNAESIVDTLMWIVRKIERLGDRMFLKPSL